jgi:RecA-family ATPase
LEGGVVTLSPKVAARLFDLRGWTAQAITRLDLGFDGEPVVFPVRDGSGELVGCIRYQPNGDRRGDEPKMRADTGTTRELFPAPETIGDDELHERLLWLVEGEPDAVRVWSLGLVAVGVPGAQNWRDEWAARFAGRRLRVVVCFDCDETGRANACRAAASLVAAGADTRVLDLDPQANGGYDLSDFLARATTAELREQAARLMRDMAERTPRFDSVGDEEQREPTDDNGTHGSWETEPWPVFRDSSPEQHRFIVDGLLNEGALAFVAAPPKKGKTWLGVGLALAVVTGMPLFGEFVIPEPRSVLYVALEGSRPGIRARIGSLTRGLGLDPDGDALDLLHLLYRPRPFDLVKPETADELRRDVERVDAALVIVDVLRAAARFKENVAEEFAHVRDALQPLLADGRTVALLHHFGKLTDTQKERSPGERMAGTGAMYGALDVGLLITRSESGARRLRVEVEARDFAAPDALGVVILGSGSGEHGGFTYTDVATLAIDATAAEERNLADELDRLFADGVWRTAQEASKKKTGIGANVDEVRDALAADPGRFVSVEGPRVGRHVNAKPWGTLAMLADVDEHEREEGARLTRLFESDKSDASETGQRVTDGTCDSPNGESHRVTRSACDSAAVESDESDADLERSP